MLEIPTLYSPFPSAINKNVAILHENTVQWTRHFHLFHKDEDYQDLSASKNTWLVARAYPNAVLEELQVVSDWMTLFVILDDVSEENEPESLVGIYERLIDILKGIKSVDEAKPLECSLEDIRHRLSAKASPEWMNLFINHCEETWNSWVWEANNRQKSFVPDVATYIKMRPFTSGLMIFFALTDIAGEISLPKSVREHPKVQRLTLLANNVISYSNDIFSLEKEINQGDFHNLVLLLQQQENISIQEAMTHAVELYNGEVQAFIDEEQQLPSWGEPLDSALNSYICTLRFWMRANVEWCQESARY